MTATSSLEHDKSSFSKILSSKEVADIIKQVVKESTTTIYPKSDVKEKIKKYVGKNASNSEYVF